MNTPLPPSLEAIAKAAPDHLKPDYAVLDKSYITAYANSQRNSRVDTEYRALGALTAVAVLDVSHDRYNGSRFVVIQPGSDKVEHVALETMSTFHVFTASGTNVMGEVSLPGSQALYALETVLGVSTTYLPWDRRVGKAPRFNHDAPANLTINSGLRFANGMVFSAITAFKSMKFEQTNATYVRVFANALDSEPNHWETGQVWDQRAMVQGVAAIGADSRVVLATTIGRLIVYSPRGGGPRTVEETREHPFTAPLHAQAVLDVQHPTLCPFAMSIALDNYFLLSAFPPGSSSSECERSGLYTSHAHEDGVWLTWLHQLNAQGAQISVTPIPFAVRQPPIDAAGGRIVLAGNGIAAVEGGAVVWLLLSPNRMRATAYRDGTLAVADGPTLRILSRDGTELQSLPTIAGEELKTPPAIAHDGSVWVAGNKVLYVARP